MSKGLSGKALFAGWLLAALATIGLPALDGAALDWVEGLRGHGVIKWWGDAAYWIGLGGLQAVFLGGVIITNWISGALHKARIWVTGLAALAISGLAAQVIKHLMGRPRPRLGLSPHELIGSTWVSDLHSFPSGHAATSFALGAVLAARYPNSAWALYGLASFVAIGRVLSGSHFPTDIWGGAILGLMIGVPLGAWAARKERPA